MPWYRDAAIMGPLCAMLSLFLPKFMHYLTNRRAEARATTLGEIARRTDISDRQIARHEQEIERLMRRNEYLESQRDRDEKYICDLEQVLREQGLRLPEPPIMKRIPRQSREVRNDDDLV